MTRERVGNFLILLRVFLLKKILPQRKVNMSCYNFVQERYVNCRLQ